MRCSVLKWFKNLLKSRNDLDYRMSNAGDNTPLRSEVKHISHTKRGRTVILRQCIVQHVTLTVFPGLPVEPGRPWREGWSNTVKEDRDKYLLYGPKQSFNQWKDSYVSSVSAIFSRGPSGALLAGDSWGALDGFVRLRGETSSQPMTVKRLE